MHRWQNYSTRPTEFPYLVNPFDLIFNSNGVDPTNEEDAEERQQIIERYQYLFQGIIDDEPNYVIGESILEIISAHHYTPQSQDDKPIKIIYRLHSETGIEYPIRSELVWAGYFVPHNILLPYKPLGDIIENAEHDFFEQHGYGHAIRDIVHSVRELAVAVKSIKPNNGLANKVLKYTGKIAYFEARVHDLTWHLQELDTIPSTMEDLLVIYNERVKVPTTFPDAILKAKKDATAETVRKLHNALMTSVDDHIPGFDTSLNRLFVHLHKIALMDSIYECVINQNSPNPLTLIIFTTDQKATIRTKSIDVATGEVTYTQIPKVVELSTTTLPYEFTFEVVSANTEATAEYTFRLINEQ